jgi:hypothetical protein
MTSLPPRPFGTWGAVTASAQPASSDLLRRHLNPALRAGRGDGRATCRTSRATARTGLSAATCARRRSGQLQQHIDCGPPAGRAARAPVSRARRGRRRSHRLRDRCRWAKTRRSTLRSATPGETPATAVRRSQRRPGTQGGVGGGARAARWGCRTPHSRKRRSAARTELSVGRLDQMGSAASGRSGCRSEAAHRLHRLRDEARLRHPRCERPQRWHDAVVDVTHTPGQPVNEAWLAAAIAAAVSEGPAHVGEAVERMDALLGAWAVGFRSRRRMCCRRRCATDGEVCMLMSAARFCERSTLVISTWTPRGT